MFSRRLRDNMKKFLTFSLTVFIIVGGFFVLSKTDYFGDLPQSLARAVKAYIQAASDSASMEDQAAIYDESVLGSEYHYYYGKLSDSDKLIYRQIYVMLDELKDGIVLDTDDVDNVSRIQQFVLLDNPQFFYVEKSQYTQTAKLVFSPVLNMSKSEIESAQSAISGYVSACMSGLSSDASDYDKAVHFYEYIIEHTDYDENSAHNQDMYSVVLGHTVCQGYAMMFKYMCDQAGIPSVIVTGATSDANHAWNMVCIDGVWSAVDCTYGDGDYLGKGISYSWFGVSSDVIKLSRTIDNEDMIPQDTSVQNDYYYRNGLYFTSYDLGTLQDMTVSSNYITFKFADKDTYDTACHKLFEQGDYKYLIPTARGGTVTYMQEPNSLAVFIHIQLGGN